MDIFLWITLENPDDVKSVWQQIEVLEGFIQAAETNGGTYAIVAKFANRPGLIAEIDAIEGVKSAEEYTNSVKD